MGAIYRVEEARMKAKEGEAQNDALYAAQAQLLEERKVNRKKKKQVDEMKDLDNRIATLQAEIRQCHDEKEEIEDYTAQCARATFNLRQQSQEALIGLQDAENVSEKLDSDREILNQLLRKVRGYRDSFKVCYNRLLAWVH